MTAAIGVDRRPSSLVRIGGDTITVTGGASTLAAGGPGSNTCTTDYHTCTPSPLVIYGDTSQDGLWYGGNPSGITLHNFGPKPLPHDDGVASRVATRTVHAVLGDDRRSIAP